MATTMSPWSKPGAWALDSEENESELLNQRSDSMPRVPPPPSSDFPSLSIAAATKPSKKKKPQTYSLAEFSAGNLIGHGHSRASKIVPPIDMLVLPTGPRERSDEELDRSRLGGGFRSYGSESGRGNERSDSKWGSSRGSEEKREFIPSRADDIDDWAASKKSTSGVGFERRGGGFFESHSKADESDSWVSKRAPVSTEGRWPDRDRRGGFELGNPVGSESGFWGRRREDSGPVSNVGTGGRPRLNLQPRTLPVVNNTQTGDVTAPVVAVKPKGPNPFGAARPREEVLAEKGRDWKQIDEKLESVKIKDVSASDVMTFGKRGSGTGDGRDDRTEKSWRKHESVLSRPSSAEEAENNSVAEK